MDPQSAHFQASRIPRRPKGLIFALRGKALKMSSREERLAANEDLFRHVNERIAELTDKWSGELDLVCECADPACTQRLVLTVDEYEQVRQDPHHFAVLPGHEIPDVEAVLARNQRYLVVEKHVETHAQMEEADPRS
jgi:hypothetical protein